MGNVDALIARARHCREFGNFDGLHGELLDMVEFLQHELHVEQDARAEHFEARMKAEARVRELEGEREKAIS